MEIYLYTYKQYFDKKGDDMTCHKVKSKSH